MPPFAGDLIGHGVHVSVMIAVLRHEEVVIAVLHDVLLVCMRIGDIEGKNVDPRLMRVPWTIVGYAIG